MNLPKIVSDTREEVSEKLKDRPKLASMFALCFPNTLETTTKRLDDGTTYVFTGDIPAMWLRDSSAQLSPYIDLAAADEDLRHLIAGAIQRQIRYIHIDPYANAFNEEASGAAWAKDETDTNPWVWERKYEIDSLCYPLWLSQRYWKATGDESIFDDEFRRAVEMILQIWRTEQHHREQSPYTFQRLDCPPSDTLVDGGLGAPVTYTGMTWSGFRPSDDACRYGYLVPSNMFATVVLSHVSNVAEQVWADEELAQRASDLRSDIESGLDQYAKVEHDGNLIYAYETDGLGNHHLMDDANVPSLLSLPYLGYCAADDPVYLSTRRFVLSSANPYYYQGRVAQGIGSPHTPHGYVWHIALAMQGLTATSIKEMGRVMDMLEATDGGTGFMHEGFAPDDPSTFTRGWFAWANSIFAEFVLTWLRRRGDG
ncbi:MAG: metal-independent alpha-mannosidase [Gemmatimonadaceae bacterium]|nr:metal-independent alpha-mannosidase [Gemmatimonadaceae bacterium]